MASCSQVTVVSFLFATCAPNSASEERAKEGVAVESSMGEMHEHPQVALISRLLHWTVQNALLCVHREM